MEGKIRCRGPLQGELPELQRYRRQFEGGAHCLREANRPADRLANVGVEVGCTTIYEPYKALPWLVRGDISLDASGFPNFRRCRRYGLFRDRAGFVILYSWGRVGPELCTFLVCINNSFDLKKLFITRKQYREKSNSKKWFSKRNYLRTKYVSKKGQSM